MIPVFNQVASNVLTLGTTAFNAVGPVFISIAGSVYLILRLLRMFSRRFFGKDFHIQYTPPARKKSNFDFSIKPWTKATVADAVVLPAAGSDGRNADAWNDLAFFLEGDGPCSEAYLVLLADKRRREGYTEEDDFEDDDSEASGSDFED